MIIPLSFDDDYDYYGDDAYYYCYHPSYFSTFSLFLGWLLASEYNLLHHITIGISGGSTQSSSTRASHNDVNLHRATTPYSGFCCHQRKRDTFELMKLMTKDNANIILMCLTDDVTF